MEAQIGIPQVATIVKDRNTVEIPKDKEEGFKDQEMKELKAF